MDGDDVRTAQVGEAPGHPFSVLPEVVRPEDMVAGQEVTPARDPENGRDTETEFMLRHLG
jgi:hypothetical protein